MKASPTFLKLLAALLVAAAPASLAVASYTGAVELPFLSASVGEESPFGGVVIEAFSESFDEPVTTGAIDLRIDVGTVHVFGWAENGYLVQVLETQEEQTLSDGETTVTFEQSFTDGTLTLSAIVDHDATYGLSASVEDRSLGDRAPQRAIVAYVPQAASYDTVFACAGQAGPLADVGDAFREVWEPLFGSSDEIEFPECVPQDTSPSATLGFSINQQREDRLNLTFGVSDLQGGGLVLAAHHSDVVAHAARFETAQLLTYYGDVELSDADVDELSVWTDYGDIDLTGTFGSGSLVTDYGDVTVEGVLDDGRITSDHGDIALDLEPRSSGMLEILGDYGDVTVEVAKGASYGYDVLAGTDYGDITLALEGAKVEERSDEDDDDGWDPSDWFQGAEERENQAHAVTEGFDSKAIQVQVLIGTGYGNVLVTDGTLFAEKEESDDDGDDLRSLAGLPTLG